MTELRIESTDATLGAIVTGVNLETLDQDDWLRIEAAFHDRAVLIFPAQHLDEDAQMSFAGRFGDLVIDALQFSNETNDGGLRKPDDPLMRLFRGNEGWHTDSSFQPLSAKASILSARKVPPSGGGETQWADMRAAYDALDDVMRERIGKLNAHHSLYHSQGKIGEAGDTTVVGLQQLHQQPGRAVAGEAEPEVAAQAYRAPEPAKAPLRPLVKIHPVTGRPALFIGRHAYGIEGLSDDDSEALLKQLLDFACQPPRVYSHTWAVGDVVIWDNRCVLHRARPWNLDEPRVMLHTRVNGDPATELAIA